ncbi:MAG: hypothetical protein Q4E24_15240 [bacterium]|nr:hypothetical protein [bacterium]
MKYTRNTVKKNIVLILCILLTGILSACGTIGKTKPTTSAELGIYAFGTTTVDNSDQGHAFLSLKNTGSETMNFLNYPVSPGEEITLGYWPAGRATSATAAVSKTGVYINFDAIKDIRNQSGKHEVVSMRKNLKTNEIQKLIDFTKEFSGTDYKSLTNNCTTYAVEAWNLVNDEKPIKDTSFLNKIASVDAPKWTREYIQKNINDETMSVGTYNPYDNLDDFHVFMVNLDGGLIPYYIDLWEYTATVDEENTPCNIDVTWEKKGKELYDGTILVNQVWVAYMKKGADESDFTEARIDADKGGCVLANLDPGATYLVKLCPLYEYSYKGKTQYVEGEWTDLMEVRVGGPVENNGGNVVGFQGNLYYWKYHAKSVSETGLFGWYEERNDIANQLVCRHPDGSEDVLLSAGGNGQIFIVGERIYLTNGMKLYSIRLDGSDKVEHGEYSPQSANETMGTLLVLSYDVKGGFYLLDSESHQMHRFTSYGERFLGELNGYYYFMQREAADKVTLYQALPDGSEIQILDQINVNDSSALYTEILELQQLGDTLYYSYGFYAGTGGMFQNGGIRSVKTNGGESRDCVSYGSLIAEEFVVENEDGQVLLYYQGEGDTYGSYIGYWKDYPYKGCTVKNLDTGKTKPSDFALSRPSSFVCMNGGIYRLLPNSHIYQTILAPEATEGFQFLDTPQGTENEIALIPRLDIIGEEVVFTVDVSRREQSMDFGWRPSYTRENSSVYWIRIGDTKATEWYSY